LVDIVIAPVMAAIARLPWSWPRTREWELLFRPDGAGSFPHCTHGLRRGLYSVASSRL